MHWIFAALLLISLASCVSGPTRHRRFHAPCSELDEQQILVPIQRTPPRYPPTFVSDVPTEAWVDVEFSIDDSGSPTSIRIIDSTPPGEYDRFALNSLRTWDFCPPAEVSSPYPPS